MAVPFPTPRGGMAPNGLGTWLPPPVAAGAPKNSLLVRRPVPTHTLRAPGLAQGVLGHVSICGSLWSMCGHAGGRAPAGTSAGTALCWAAAPQTSRLLSEAGGSLPSTPRGHAGLHTVGLRLPSVSRGAGCWPHTTSAMASPGRCLVGLGNALGEHPVCGRSSWRDRVAAGFACWQHRSQCMAAGPSLDLGGVCELVLKTQGRLRLCIRSSVGLTPSCRGTTRPHATHCRLHGQQLLRSCREAQAGSHGLTGASSESAWAVRPRLLLRQLLVLLFRSSVPGVKAAWRAPTAPSPSSGRCAPR